MAACSLVGKSDDDDDDDDDDEGHSYWVTSVAFSPDGATVMTGSDDRTARLWTTGGELLQTLAVVVRVRGLVRAWDAGGCSGGGCGVPRRCEG